MVLAVKNPTANSGDARDLIRSLDREYLLEEEMATHSRVLGLRSLVGYSPWGHKESDMTQWLSTQHSVLKHPHDCQRDEQHRDTLLASNTAYSRGYWESRFSLRAKKHISSLFHLDERGYLSTPINSGDLNYSPLPSPLPSDEKQRCISDYPPSVLCWFHCLSSLLIFSVQLFHNALFLISFSCSPPLRGDFISCCSFKQQLQVNNVQMLILSSNHFKKLTTTFTAINMFAFTYDYKFASTFAHLLWNIFPYLQIKKKERKEKKKKKKERNLVPNVASFISGICILQVPQLTSVYQLWLL